VTRGSRCTGKRGCKPRPALVSPGPLPATAPLAGLALSCLLGVSRQNGVVLHLMSSPDLLIVGSGPIGCVFARIIHDLAPRARILMVEAGPQLTGQPGMHVKNISDRFARAAAQRKSEGPDADHSSCAPSPSPRGRGLTRPGTFSANVSTGIGNGLPAAAMSANVGGMGAHWTCAAPRPDAMEMTPLLRALEWRAALRCAEGLLHVSTEAFGRSTASQAILETLRQEYSELPPGRNAQLMPLACTVINGSRYWSGTDVILGPLAQMSALRFELRALTLCRRLTRRGERITSAQLVDLTNGAIETVRPRFVVVAADSLRTPQLLWASGIRPRALGHYLNDHIQILAAVASPLQALGEDDQDSTAGVLWLPYSKVHPFHSQVMHFDVRPAESDMFPDGQPGESVIGLGWLVPKQVSYQNFVRFSADETDLYGMPQLGIKYYLSRLDRKMICQAIADQLRAARVLAGTPPDSLAVRVLPAGSSLHYQGTVRIGRADDGTSVCNSYGMVWGFQNLVVGGNGVIPTRTAGNPTLMSCALAVRAAERIARHLL
jgi:choline dehydrogenase-like flavoprotein